MSVSIEAIPLNAHPRDPNNPFKCSCGHDLWYCPDCEQPGGKHTALHAPPERRLRR